jgi:hypothetical protein
MLCLRPGNNGSDLNNFEVRRGDPFNWYLATGSDGRS